MESNVDGSKRLTRLSCKANISSIELSVELQSQLSSQSKHRRSAITESLSPVPGILRYLVRSAQVAQVFLSFQGISPPLKVSTCQPRIGVLSLTATAIWCTDSNDTGSRTTPCHEYLRLRQAHFKSTPLGASQNNSAELSATAPPPTLQ
jgi:hypothetical protein